MLQTQGAGGVLMLNTGTLEEVMENQGLRNKCPNMASGLAMLHA